MGIGGSLSGIRFAGLGSGIDTDSIVRQFMQIESIPVARMQLQQQILQSRQSIFQQLRTQVRNVAAAASGLNIESTYRASKATSSDTAVATVSANSDAAIGTFTVRVSKLAQAQKIATDAQASATEPLNLAGDFVVNGKGVSVSASDTLATIAQKINGAGAGVTASVIDGGGGNAYLSLTANKTGADSKIQLADVGGSNIVGSLGLLTGAAAIRKPITNGFSSMGFRSSSTGIGEMLRLPNFPTSTVGIGSGTIEINASDTLETIAQKINDPVNGTGATAVVVTETKDGQTVYRLDVTGPSTPALSDSNGVLEALGFLQRSHKNVPVAAQDAEFTVDDVAFKSANNSVTTAIPGVTLTLLKADAANPPTTTISISRDNEAIKKNFKGLVDAYNGLVDFVRKNSSFDKDTFKSGPLMGDPTATGLENGLVATLFGNIANLTGPYANMTQIGLGMDETGKLSLDEPTLDKALAENPNAVGELMRAVGTSSGDKLAFISGSSKTKASPAAGYEVVVTQLATKGVFETTENGATVTFKGPLFGSGQVTLVLGANVDESVARINNDAKLRDVLVAENVAGTLRITSKRYGTTGNFVVEGATGTTTDGVNVAGTIHGEAATGNGQYLTGNAGNANTDGLQVQVTATSTGSVGRIVYTKGVASLAQDLIESYTDTVNGALTATDKSIQQQIDDLGASIKAFEERLKLRERTLRDRFTAMERAISALQAQQARLGAMR